MKIEFNHQPIERVETPLLIAVGFEGEPASSGTVGQLPDATRKMLEDLQASGELIGKLYECTLIHNPPGLAAERLLIVGGGKREKMIVPHLARLAGTAARYARGKGIHKISWFCHPQLTNAESVKVLVEGAIMADYDADKYRSDRKPDRRIDHFELIADAAKTRKEEIAAIEQGRVIGESANFTRDLVNEPSNLMTPTILAGRAQEMAKEFGLESKVLGTEEIRALKMNAFWAVAQGSGEPPRLIMLRYTPPDAPAAPVIGLVGKGITFDTGGISIKPAASMEEMKTDMAGGATMLGVMRAIAQLKPKVRVIAVVPATENMPGGKAFKPGDVITAMSGKTIEILNTDAEGRLVLADALHYAKQQGATILIDAATLTGAVTIALGNITTGVFSNNKEWAGRVLASAAATGERMWELPVDDDYRDYYKSSIADIANTGGRYGGAITAAMFVGEFAGDTPWVHLDIAGTRWNYEEKPYLAKGPSGHPVRTLVHLLMNLK
ncbi:MAG TPA: leucyl aminopeptidase [Terriglobia bacterium]|nr:leucyl aminopeptidase [Terriglobia bacterium]